MTETTMDLQHRLDSHQAALEQIDQGSRFAIRLPLVGDIGVPRPEQLAYFAALGLLAAFELIDWPVALAIAAGHALAADQHHRALQEVGEALESA
ncbi:hypothetical protein AB4Z09_02170 [Rhodococcus sp. TAF43]|uniref:hypothetical protein n=1 Tax=unclassified Rhodococcus (in: high G+C Gram-positive bacteria) TaxID=192944 RepID=UPI000E0C5065|nr:MULTISPECIES: hypothetical protein [unclassified Rhodococcus (in: high G+C Gram-positive bacteria)]QKT10890.1 hypothetical protein HUN07_09335 [Rhodococcus sp. W8901]RDI15692.1 hypothetical protein DEU38_13136 [Rhodococcus sp. AG1013]